jgi:acid phosphatase
MSLRPLVAAIAAAAASAAVAVPAAEAATTRTEAAPADIRMAYKSGSYTRGIDKAYRAATSYLAAQMARHPKVRRPAVVLDIDETALSNYGCLDAADFALIGMATCVLESRSTAIPAARRFVRFAQRSGVRVAFITGAPDALCDGRRRNLRKAGFVGRWTVTCRPATRTEDSVVPYKSGARKALEAKGYTILANIGDQRSDLRGGAARRAFKLPNPIYVTG